MYMAKEKFTEIIKNHDTLVLVEDDLFDAFDLVWKLLCAETDALKDKEPYATHTINRLEEAAYEVHELGYDIDDEGWMEGLQWD